MGNEPQGNAKAEATVGIVKRGARKLLSHGGLDKEMWPYAVIHFADLAWNEFFGEKSVLPPFGSKVYTRIKLHDFTDEWLPKMVPGTYLGKAPDGSANSGWILLDGGELRRGHVLKAPESEDVFMDRSLEGSGWRTKRDPDSRRFFEHESGQRQWEAPSIMIEEETKELPNRDIT